VHRTSILSCFSVKISTFIVRHKTEIESESMNILVDTGYTKGIHQKRDTVKFTLEQATKAQRGSRGIALLFL